MIITNTTKLLLTLLVAVAAFGFSPASVSAATCADGTEIPTSALAGDRAADFCTSRGGYTPSPTCPGNTICAGNPGGTTAQSGDTCGSNDNNDQGKDPIQTSIDFGCTGSGNGIQDLGYAIIRFLSVGVLLVLIASTVYAGIQYTVANADPGKVSQAKMRLFNVSIALMIYIFAFAIINYVVPGGLLK